MGVGIKSAVISKLIFKEVSAVLLFPILLVQMIRNVPVQHMAWFSMGNRTSIMGQLCYKCGVDLVLTFSIVRFIVRNVTSHDRPTTPWFSCADSAIRARIVRVGNTFQDQSNSAETSSSRIKQPGIRPVPGGGAGVRRIPQICQKVHF